MNLVESGQKLAGGYVFKSNSCVMVAGPLCSRTHWRPMGPWAPRPWARAPECRQKLRTAQRAEGKRSRSWAPPQCSARALPVARRVARTSRRRPLRRCGAFPAPRVARVAARSSPPGSTAPAAADTSKNGEGDPVRRRRRLDQDAGGVGVLPAEPSVRSRGRLPPGVSLRAPHGPNTAASLAAQRRC